LGFHRSHYRFFDGGVFGIIGCAQQREAHLSRLMRFLLCIAVASLHKDKETLREAILMSVPGPTTGILSFASPKESIQRKGDPDAA